MEIQKKICLSCKNEFLPGKRDKKYCNNSCRSSYHNKKNNIDSASYKFITRLLKNDFLILIKLLEGKNFLEIAAKKLIELGFSFKVHTHFEQVGNEKKMYIALSDFYYVKTENKTYKIFRI